MRQRDLLCKYEEDRLSGGEGKKTIAQPPFSGKPCFCQAGYRQDFPPSLAPNAAKKLKVLS